MAHEVVIVGGGAGGLELAVKLGRARGPAAVLLVDRSVFHVWKPTLHEVAAGTLDPHREGLSYPMLARRHGFSFMLGDLGGVDRDARTIVLKPMADDTGAPLLPERVVPYRRLVLAIGSGSNLFDTPGAEHAYVLENVEDAQRFRTRFLAAVIKAAYATEKVLHLAIVGGGATGVELSAELIEAHRELKPYLGVAAPELRLTLIEAAPRILGALTERISEEAVAALRGQGATVMTGTKVLRISPEGIETSEGMVPAELVVWAAGIKASAENARYGLAVNRLNQFEVDAFLRTSDPNIYALGDCAACPWVEGRTVPPRAQAAHQQASYLATALEAERAGRPPGTPYVYKDFGSLVSVGHRHAVGDVAPAAGRRSLFVAGLIAKAMYLSLHFAHQRAVLGLIPALMLRLSLALQHRISGRMKLH